MFVHPLSKHTGLRINRIGCWCLSIYEMGQKTHARISELKRKINFENLAKQNIINADKVKKILASL